MTRIPVGAPSRSVTALGWSFAALGLTVLAGLLLPEVRDSAWMVLALAVLSVLFTVMGVGLLQRLDWARRTFVLLLGAALGGVALALWPQVQWLQSAASVQWPLAALLGSLALAGMLAWAIGRLVSPRVRREFA